MTCQGSGGGSVKHRLLFPRFLQVEGVSLLKAQ